ncbi:MAG: amino acid permease [Phycisphaerales bacterium]|nr:amino acid permease [Phycisphaerales bacterium]
MSDTRIEGAGPGVPDLPRKIGLWGAVAVMVGVMVGSGIFQTPTEIAKHLGDPWVILGMWAAGGVLSLLGALTYAEMATMYPRSGGVYVFLREGYGRGVAFVFGWTYMLISKPYAAAGIAVIGVRYFNGLIGVSWSVPLETTLVLIVLTGINAWGVREGTRLAMVLTALKVGALAAIVVLALALRKGSGANFAGSPLEGNPGFLVAIVPVMAAVLWTYDGWSDVGAIAGEVERPRWTLPRAYLVGTLGIMGLYLAVNAVYLWMLPLEEIRGAETVAPLVMERLLGAAAGTAVTVLVIVSTMGSSHSSVMTGARVTFAQARDGLLFRFLGRVHPTRQTPAVALWVQCGLSCLAVWTMGGSFASLAEGFVFTMWIFYGLAGAAIFILRAKRPGVERPFRCPGYPVVPAVFVLSALAMTVFSVTQDVSTWTPGADVPTTIVWLGVLAAGFPVFLLWERLTARGTRV